MRSMFAILVSLILITVSAPNYAQMNSSISNDKVFLDTLSAIHFADSYRLLIENDCKYSSAADPEFYAALCSKLKIIPNSEIEKLALSLLKTKMSEVDARSSIEFYSSFAGSPNSTSISQFRNSSPGKTLELFLTDPILKETIVKGIINYVP